MVNKKPKGKVYIYTNYMLAEAKPDARSPPYNNVW